MTPSTTHLLLGLLAAALYALLSHVLMVYAANTPWAIAAVFGPGLLPVLGLAWRGRQPVLLALTVLAAAGLVWVAAAGGLGDVKHLYLAQHAGMHAALGLSFGWTLRPGHTALISAMARRVHAVSPAMAHYTRGLTWLWVAYFFGMALLSLGVFVGLSWAAWSLLANVLTPLAMGVLFVGEHALRYRLHPEFERVSLAGMVRAYRQPASQPSQPSVRPDAGSGP